MQLIFCLIEEHVNNLGLIKLNDVILERASEKIT